MLLRVENLATHFDTPAGVVRAVDGVSLRIPAGRTLALVGESGCGKSVAALSILRLVPSPGKIVSGQIWFHDRELLSLPEKEMRALRGDRIAMVFQEPMSSLNPVMTIGEQIAEVLRVHRHVSRRPARERTLTLLSRVGIPAPPERFRQYPHQMSGGMRQRVMIAMALACEPELLIADEVTTALDVTVQTQILTLLRELQHQTGMAMLFITHDLGLVTQVADAVAVMYAGRIVEQAPAARIFTAARHPYTRGLCRCTPRLAGDARPGRLPVIPGEVPPPLHRPSGCPFHPRCELGRDDPTCRTEVPPLDVLDAEQACACWQVPARLPG